jgi:hypothetical protein
VRLLCVRYPFVATEMAETLFNQLLPVDPVRCLFHGH